MDADLSRLIAEVEDEHWWFVARRKIVAAVLEKMHLPDHARILDIGCGSGGNLAMLARFGHLTAVEMDPYSRNIAETRGICEVVAGSLPSDMPLESSAYDLITALDVIEHVEDHVGGLAEIRRLLSSGGAVVVTVPAYEFLWSDHDEVNRHFRRYTVRRLEAAMRESGFDIAHMTYFNTWLFPVIAAARLANRIIPIGGGRDVRLPPTRVNRILTRVFASEGRLAASHYLPFGLSILAVCRRSA